MKILFVGNVANHGYLIAKQMRANGIDMELLLCKNPNKMQDPLKRDPTLEGKYPNWINFYDTSKPVWKLKILRKMREKKYDVIQGHYNFLIYGLLSRKPLISQPIGSELSSLAFRTSINGFLMRRALKYSKGIIVSSPKQVLLLKKLKIKNYFLIPFSPEYPFFHPIDNYKRNYLNELVIFHPTNLNWKTKGNKILIDGFAEFVKNYPNSILVMVDHGIDSKKTRNLIKYLDLEKKVKILNGPLTYNELRFYYNTADIIADQFIGDEIGAIGRETLCSRKPLLANFNEALYKTIYENLPPVIRATSSKEICAQLEVLSDKNTRNTIGRDSRNWIEKNASLSIFVKKNKIIYESIINKENFEDIKEKLNNLK